MKTEASLTLSEDLLQALDRLAGPGMSRSAFVEAILRNYVEGRVLAREIAAIHRHAAQLNAERPEMPSYEADDADIDKG